MPLPNFFLIGANKSGTTSLYRYLDQHKEIYLSPLKEPCYYLFEKELLRPRDSKAYHAIYPHLIKTHERYRQLFSNVSGEKAIGEASTAYLAFPGAATTIKKYHPTAKIIAILRNNTERAYSNYSMCVGLKWEERSFEQIIHDEIIRGDEGERFIHIGFYYEQIKTYIDLFGEGQVSVYLYEDLKNRPRWLIEDIFRFLDVDPTFIPDLSEKHNVSTFTDPMPDSAKAYLTGLYREDNIKLQSLIKRDLSGWIGPPVF